MSEIAKLLERVKSAEGPNHDLSRDICVVAGMTCIDFWWSWPDDAASYAAPPHVTASIDAALALTERVLPGWVVTDLSQNAYLAGDPWGCALAYYNGGDPSKNRAAESGYDFPKAPLAILVATLSAIQDQRP